MASGTGMRAAPGGGSANGGSRGNAGGYPAPKAVPLPKAPEPKAPEPKAPESTSFRFEHIFTQDREVGAGKVTDSYTLEKNLLGEGSYGEVSKGVHKATGAKRAVKAISIKKIADKDRFNEEVNVQRSLDHPHIVKLYEVFRDKEKVYMVMELCTGGELFDRIIAESQKHGPGHAFGEGDAARIMQQIYGAVRYLHGRKYVHRDIKPENFLLQNAEKQAPIKVIDFGLAKQFVPGTNDLHTKAGTPYYVAPEVLRSTKTNGYNEKCDIWSCGVLAYILLCGYPPFYGDSDDQILKMVKKGTYDFPKQDWDAVSKNAKDFINVQLQLNTDKRASAEQLMSHAWLKEANNAEEGKRLASGFTNNLKAFRSSGKFKRVCLTLIAKHMKEEDISELESTFLALDKDKDGTLTAKEIKVGLEKHKLQIPEDLQETLESLDTDGSGVIDYTEFIAATMTQKHYAEERTLWNAFSIFDRDNSGSITKDELMDVLKDISREDAGRLLLEADTDMDGMISFEEFKEMMMPKKGSKTQSFA